MSENVHYSSPIIRQQDIGNKNAGDIYECKHFWALYAKVLLPHWIFVVGYFLNICYHAAGVFPDCCCLIFFLLIFFSFLWLVFFCLFCLFQWECWQCRWIGRSVVRPVLTTFIAGWTKERVFEWDVCFIIFFFSSSLLPFVPVFLFGSV